MSLFKRDRLPQGETLRDKEPEHVVLIVDDEEGNLRVLRSMLAEKFRILEARDGREALEMLEGLQPLQMPSVILSDQRMPRMTGVELFEKVRDLLPGVIRIIITGFVDVGAIVDAINRAGIYKFVVKPFDRHDLLLTVERAIEAYELRRQVDRHIEELEHKVKERTHELEAKNDALQRAYAEIEHASLHDALTGLGNRRFLTRSLSDDDQVERRHTEGRRVAFLLVDVDHFKAVNDSYGHAAGDAVLTGLAVILRQHCREGDVAARWGGEEFLLRVIVDGEEQALRCAERLRQRVAETPFPIGDGRQLSRTCSIGIACLPFDPSDPDRLDWERVLSVADAALYMAKRSGRNAAYGLACAGSLPADFEQRIAEGADDLVGAGVLRVYSDRAD